MKFAEGIVDVLEAFDLTKSYRDAAELAGCSPSTVARYVALREQGGLRVRPLQRSRLVDPYLEKVEEWVNASRGKVRADVAYQKLVDMGFQGSERTVRRAVQAVKRAYRQGHRRVYQPWIVEPGLWAQWDYGLGPEIQGQPTLLFCAWLAWSRYRVIIPILDRSQGTVIWCIDTALRRFGGCPTYALSDNEKTLTTGHIAGIAIREAEMVAVGRYYGLSFRSCVPYDPETKGGSESTVRVAKADLVPTEANLLEKYGQMVEMEEACAALELEVNTRPHRVTRRPPMEMLMEERQRLHPLPAEPYTRALGESRVVGQTTPMVMFQGGEYSVPWTLAGETVWVRMHGEDVIMVRAGEDGAQEVARHRRTTPGHPRVKEEHFPPRRHDPLNRQPKARTKEEADFLQLGPGASSWLVAAGAAGASRVRSKMAQAVSLSKIHGTEAVAEALSQAGSSGRFGGGDLESILTYQATVGTGKFQRASESFSLQGGTSDWAGVGR